jgi:hypothetical protein
LSCATTLTNYCKEILRCSSIFIEHETNSCLHPAIFFFNNYSQQALLLFKKKNITVQSFWVGSIIAFQLRDEQWQKGEITKIRNDSFFIRPVVVQYSLLTTDTFYYNVLGFSVSDVYAMPKRESLSIIKTENSRYQGQAVISIGIG